VTIADGAFRPGPAVWVGGREVAHFDNDRTLDVRLTKSEIRKRRSDLAADDRVHLRSGNSDWLEIEIRSETDADFAISIVRTAVAANLPTAPRNRHETRPGVEKRG
jgi:Family of unknown function (DUF5519)